ncbi:hypothetical protein ACS0TY_020350 [Phlomoides rotata]
MEARVFGDVRGRRHSRCAGGVSGSRRLELGREACGSSVKESDALLLWISGGFVRHERAIGLASSSGVNVILQITNDDGDGDGDEQGMRKRPELHFSGLKMCLRGSRHAPEYKPYRQKDGALLAIGALCDKLKQIEPYKSELEPMLVRHVFPEFSSPVGHLRAKLMDLISIVSPSLDFNWL